MPTNSARVNTVELEEDDEKRESSSPATSTSTAGSVLNIVSTHQPLTLQTRTSTSATGSNIFLDTQITIGKSKACQGTLYLQFIHLRDITKLSAHNQLDISKSCLRLCNTCQPSLSQVYSILQIFFMTCVFNQYLKSHT